MADTELDEILKDWEHIIKSVAMAEIYGVVNVGFSYNRQEAKQKLLKLIDKEVTRSRIDELKALVPPEQFKDYVKLTGHEACTICGFNSEVFRRHLESRIKAIQEEGTDNG